MKNAYTPVIGTPKRKWFRLATVESRRRFVKPALSAELDQLTEVIRAAEKEAAAFVPQTICHLSL